jgi:hypothetical protein
MREIRSGGAAPGDLDAVSDYLIRTSVLVPVRAGALDAGVFKLDDFGGGAAKLVLAGLHSDPAGRLGSDQGIYL